MHALRLLCCAAVQEHHHCALTFQLLRTNGNLLGRFSERAEWQAARRLLVDAILSTDMHGHFALTQELQKHGPVFSPDVDSDRALLIKAILHAADISNPLRPWAGALAGAERVHAEFQQQAAQERQQELPVAPHMEASDPAVWARMEVEFIDYVVGPLWSRLSQFYPALQQPLQQMYDNRARFMAMAQHGPPEAPPSASADDNGSDSSGAPTFFTGSGRRPRSRGEQQQQQQHQEQGVLSSVPEQPVASVSADGGRGRRNEGGSDDAISSDYDSSSAAGSPTDDVKVGSRTEQPSL
ncbi:hypothetical protein COO60DRAFT_253735 [Scenedesmus sp. NREL 46B-D3]|nr:hypothetical protein COO60DRAFT_253735 [Scenedesmus sp. NREL 46B-D3]